MSITVLIAEDNEMMLSAVVRLLHTATDIQILGQGDGYAQAIELASKLQPQVIVLDIHMKDERVFTQEQIKSGLSGSRLVGISFWNDDETKAYANSLGADMLLDKANLNHELIPAIRNCANGAPTQ